MLEKNGIIYELLQEKDLQATINCLVDVFTNDEALTKELKFTTEEFEPFAEITCIKAVEDQLSWVAKDAETAEVVGFTIAQDLLGNEQEFQLINEKTVVKFQPIFNLLEKLEVEYLKNQPEREKGKLFYIFMIGVNQKYRGRKIILTLIEESFQAAKQKNYQFAMTECTSYISRSVFMKLGFKEIVLINYQDYLYGGKPVFQGLAESHKKCVLMERVL